MFQSMLPTTGIGVLLGVLHESNLYDTDKEKTLHKSRNVVWLGIDKGLVEEGIDISVSSPKQVYDIGSASAVVGQTGGQMSFYPRFDPPRGGAALESQIQRVMRRYQYLGMQRYNAISVFLWCDATFQFLSSFITDDNQKKLTDLSI